MRGFFPISAACVKCPPPPDRLPSLDLRFREKRLAGQPAPRRRAQTLKSPPNRAFYRFSLRARKHKEAVPAGTVFLSTGDEKRPDHKCLIGYGAVLADSGKVSSEMFPGATNWIELVALVGAEKAKGLANRLTK